MSVVPVPKQYHCFIPYIAQLGIRREAFETLSHHDQCDLIVMRGKTRDQEL